MASINIGEPTEQAQYGVDIIQNNRPNTQDDLGTSKSNTQRQDNEGALSHSVYAREVDVMRDPSQRSSNQQQVESQRMSSQRVERQQYPVNSGNTYTNNQDQMSDYNQNMDREEEEEEELRYDNQHNYENQQQQYENQLQYPVSQDNSYIQQQQQQFQQFPLQQRKELLTITIDLGNGNHENIVVMDGDNPFDLSLQFSIKHQLNPKLKDLLALQIQNNIDQVIIEKQQQQQQQLQEEQDALYMQQQQLQQQYQMQQQQQINQQMMGGSNAAPQTYYQNSRVSNQPYQMIEEEMQFYNDQESNNPLEGTTKINQDDTNNTSAVNFLNQYPTNTHNNYYSKPVNSKYLDPSRMYTSKQHYHTNQTKSPLSTQSPFRLDQSGIRKQSACSRQQYNPPSAPYMQQVPYISDNSRKIAMAKRPQSSHMQPNVHERLYKQELEKTKVAQAKMQQLQIDNEKQREIKMLKSPKRVIQGGDQSQQDLNFGVRLYQKGLKIQEEKERFCKLKKEDQDKQIVEGLNFKPQLIAKQREKSQGRNNTNNQKRELDLIQYGQQLIEKKEKARAEIQQYQEQQYKYKPEINKKSERIIREKSSFLQMCSPQKKTLDQQLQNLGQGTNNNHQQQQDEDPRPDKYHELYEDARQRQDRMSKVYAISMDKECTFKPRLVTAESKLAKSILNKTHITSSTDQQENDMSYLGKRQDESMGKSFVNSGAQVYERLSQNVKQKNDRSFAIAQIQRNDENIDPVTGKPYFHPRTGRSPLNRPSDLKHSIGEHLYAHHKQISEKHQKLKKDEDMKFAEMRRSVHSQNRKSDKMVENSKRSKLQDIFDIFDHDSDGIISATKIDLHSLPTEVLEVFTPLLCEMEEIGTTLDREEFVEASSRLFSTLNVYQRNLILQFRRIPKQQQNPQMDSCTFAPQLNSKSMRIAEKTLHSLQSQHQSKHDDIPVQALSLADRLNMKRQETENKIRQQKEEKERNELIGCTFHPIILSNANNNQFYQNVYTFGGHQDRSQYDPSVLMGASQQVEEQQEVDQAMRMAQEAMQRQQMQYS